MYEWREEERTLQWRVGGEEGRSGTITGSRKQDGGWSLLLPLTLCLHPLLPQPQARTKHGTAAHFTPPTFDLLHKDGTIWARCLQIKCNISVILSALEGNKRIHFVKTFPDRVQCCPMQCSWVGVETASVYTHYLLSTYLHSIYPARNLGTAVECLLFTTTPPQPQQTNSTNSTNLGSVFPREPST